MYKISEFANRVGVSIQTLRLWHKQGILIPACCTNGGQRRYSEAQVQQYLYKQKDLLSIGFMDGVHDSLIKEFLCSKGSQFEVTDNMFQLINICHMRRIKEIVFYNQDCLNNCDDILNLLQNWGISIIYIDNTEGGVSK